ncbi:hypothetical protein [Nocardioides marmorisolisilvae]|uniref:Uncharacterized protein n=1 Tax=Nocardioides marmorisolisilvae TaxID=1542737 RepID=A0A3N0DNS0_9ACTN|nr:hypothetical protein [Nocardioides marmorisolisilvae]RNL77299.1 hypothetical protein EFL95_17715 [Nocardioides marmorisolisilvae]
MALWRRPFELTIPAPSDAVLAAASAVDPNTLHDAQGFLNRGYGLDIAVVGASAFTANVWSPAGQNSYRGPRLRATAESDGSRTRLVGELWWQRLQISFTAMPLMVVAAIYGGFWGARRRPDEVAFSHWFFWSIAAALTLLIVFAWRRLPQRMAKEETQLKDALLRDLS